MTSSTTPPLVSVTDTDELIKQLVAAALWLTTTQMRHTEEGDGARTATAEACVMDPFAENGAPTVRFIYRVVINPNSREMPHDNGGIYVFDINDPNSFDDRIPTTALVTDSGLLLGDSGCGYALQIDVDALRALPTTTLARTAANVMRVQSQGCYSPAAGV